MEEITNSLQENILLLLVFHTDTAGVIASNVTPKLFGNAYYRNIAYKAIGFYSEFKEAPKEHIADLLEHELNDEKTKTIYSSILKSLYENKDSVHKDYVLKSLEKFVRGQNLKIAVKEAFEALGRNDIDKAEHVLETNRRKGISLFDPGTFFLKEQEKSLSFLDVLTPDNIIYTGIPYLDQLEICPTPRELFVLVGRSGGGKSWFLVHMGKYALMQRKKVLHITLELDEERVKARYYQSLFGIANKLDNDTQKNIINLKFDQYGNLEDFDYKQLTNIVSLRDDNIRDVLAKKSENLFYNPQLIVKGFPTGTLSITGLKMYLDNLEAYHNFIPDIILLDYLDLMEIDVERMRIDLGQTAIALRGIAVERNLAMVTVAQTNKSGEGRLVLTRRNLAEDFSKVRISDNLITYNQSLWEAMQGMARIYVDKARNNRTGDLILLVQNYSIGQFHLHSSKCTNKYYEILKGKGIKLE